MCHGDLFCTRLASGVLNCVNVFVIWLVMFWFETVVGTVACHLGCWVNEFVFCVQGNVAGRGFCMSRGCVVCMLNLRHLRCWGWGNLLSCLWLNLFRLVRRCA